MAHLTALFVSMSVQYQLPPNLLSSLCWVESNHNISAIHHDDGDSDSLGVCQIKLSTARSLGFKGSARQLMIPRNNIKYAAKFLKFQMNRYRNLSKAVIAYNKGNARHLTTSSYQRKVFNRWRIKK